MKIFDLHADLGKDITIKSKDNKDNILATYHLEKLKKGEVEYVGCACFFDGSQNWDDMVYTIEKTCAEINKSDVIFVKEKNDLLDQDKIKMILTVEGMCGIDEDHLDKITYLHEKGVKIASLCWNEENALATGVKGNELRGLTKKGEEVIAKMKEFKMILDLSHTNEKTFWDIMGLDCGPIMATHSNVRNICKADRNLTDQQIKAIAKKGGIIGMNAARYFVNDDEDKQDALNLAKHAKYISELVGIEHLAIGFDYMDFLRDFTKEQSPMCKDLLDASYSQNFIKALFEVGFDQKEVEMIAFENACNFLKKWL